MGSVVVPSNPPSPDGVEKGTLEYYKKKFEAAMDLNARLRDIPITPKEAGVLTVLPNNTQRADSKRQRLTESEYGSENLKDMLSIKRAKRLEAEEERARIEGNKAARAAKKQQQEEEENQLQMAWAVCGDNAVHCVCGDGRMREDCPMWGMQRCPSCTRITKHKCRKAGCKLALTAPAPLALPMPTPSAV